MSRTKDQYHDKMPGPGLTLKEDTGHLHAQEEYYAEQRRQRRNARIEAGKNVPVADPITPTFEGRRTYPANPATDRLRFKQTCWEADREAQRRGMNIVVFMNRENNYFTWEEKYISGANQIEALYVAKPVEVKK